MPWLIWALELEFTTTLPYTYALRRRTEMRKKNLEDLYRVLKELMWPMIGVVLILILARMIMFPPPEVFSSVASSLA